jgi:hypothetical protein
MRTITLIPLMILLSTPCSAQDVFGTWKMNPTRSKFSDEGQHPQALTLRIEPHKKGIVFTFDRLTSHGQAETVSTLLYLDGQERNYQSVECLGTQASRRLDRRTVELITKCDQTIRGRVIFRLLPQADELFLDISGIQPLRVGQRFQQRFVLEKASSGEGDQE